MWLEDITHCVYIINSLLKHRKTWVHYDVDMRHNLQLYKMSRNEKFGHFRYLHGAPVHSRVIAASLECFTQKSSLCRNEQVCRGGGGGWSVKRFEQSNELGKSR